MFAASNDIVQAVILYLDCQHFETNKRKILTHKDRYANHGIYNFEEGGTANETR